MSESEEQEHFVAAALALGYGVVRSDGEVRLVDKTGETIHSFINEEQTKWSELTDQLQTLTAKTAVDRSIANSQYNERELVIYTDGGSRGNPGPSASGFVIMNTKEQILEEGGEYLGVTTNNQAEYQAVKIALETALKYHPSKIEFRIDSLLVVNQMNGVYKIKNRDLWPIHSAIKELVEQVNGSVKFTHVRREFNTLADQKVNEVLDAQTD